MTEAIAKPSIAAVLTALGATEDFHESGGWKVMRCPFHDDRAASASYNPDLERFRCHGCGIAGDGYDLLMEVERCDFATARNRATELCGAASRPLTDSGSATITGRSKLTARRSNERAKLVRRKCGKR